MIAIHSISEALGEQHCLEEVVQNVLQYYSEYCYHLVGKRDRQRILSFCLTD